MQRNPVQLVSKNRRKESVSMMNGCRQIEQERTKCSSFTYYDEGEDVTELMMMQ